MQCPMPLALAVEHVGCSEPHARHTTVAHNCPHNGTGRNDKVGVK